MSEVGELFRDYKEDQKNLKELFGVPCPICVLKLPKTNPKILLPGGYCKMHKYKDQRDRSIMDDIRQFKEVREVKTILFPAEN